MNYAYRMAVRSMEDHQNRLAKIPELTKFHDIARKVAAYWCELTGEKVKVSSGDWQGVTIMVHMGHLMPNGQYPSKAKELAYIREYADHLLDGLFDFDNFKVTHDTMSTDFIWGKAFRDPVIFRIYANHGGNCKYVKVGTKLVEEDIYEAECD